MRPMTMRTATERMAPRPSLARLAAVELRKLADTRAGIALLGAVALAAAGTVAVQLVVGEPRARTVAALFSAALVPAGVLLPIVGILSVTGEWAQRGALVTFALVPRRERVVAAKLLAVGIVALLTVDVCLGAAAAGHAVSVATGHGGGGSRITADALGEAMAGEVLLALLGVGFGLLLRSSTLAIAVYLVVPSAWSILAATVGWLHGWAGWLSLDAAVGPLQQGASLPAQGWARVAAVAGLWLLLPLLAGLARLARTEVG